jgi:hypothetical protein
LCKSSQQWVWRSNLGTILGFLVKFPVFYVVIEMSCGKLKKKISSIPTNITPIYWGNIGNIGLVFSFCKFFAIHIQFFRRKVVRRQNNSLIFGMWYIGTNTQLLRPQAIWNLHFSKKSIHPNDQRWIISRHVRALCNMHLCIVFMWQNGKLYF